MQPEAIEESRDWLSRAERDLLIAGRAIGNEPALADQCAFHAQQAAEKALKAFLVLASVPFPKSHDLIRFVAMCQGIDETFGQFLSV
ncbi:MAG TPA: HEPN domain-containing protein, partial [Thermomicrobiales bacterium]|nr:HEPN domain-containing protein [Thermomicrobiales bacterium]